MPLAAPFVPVVTLLLGAALLPLAKNVARGRAVQAVAIGVLSIALLATGSLYLARPLAWTAQLWRPASLFGLELGYYADSVSISCVFLLMVVALIALLADLPQIFLRGGDVEIIVPLFLALGGAGSVLLAADLVSVVLSWGFLDLALFLLTVRSDSDHGGPKAATRLLLTNYLGGVALAGGLLVLLARGETFSLGAAPMPALAISLMMGAALLRLRLYPAFLAATPGWERALVARVLWHVMPVVVGGYLLVRALGLAAMTSLPGSGLGLVLASMSIALAPFGLWFEPAVEKAAPYLVLSQVGHMALAAVIGAAYSPAVIGSQVVTLVFALAVLFLGQFGSLQSGPRACDVFRRCCMWAAIAALVATPLTVGFVARQMLYASLVGSRLALLVLVSALANSLMVPPLLKMGLASAPAEGEQNGRLLLRLSGLTLTALPLVVFGLFPQLLGRLLGIRGVLAPWPTALALVYSPDSLSPTLLAVVTIGSLALGYLMYRRGSLMVDKAGDALETLHWVARAEWLYRAVGRAGEVVVTVVENIGGFFEGSRSAGWILAFATLIALLLLSS